VALETSAERPAPVRAISMALGGWIHRLGPVWVEGQVAQLARRPGAGTLFLTLRDPAADVSLQVSCPRQVLEAVDPPLQEGTTVVVHGRPRWYFPRGTVSLAATELRAVGVGALLARLERLRALLAAEGLFDDRRKRPLPFLPRVVGLVCGRGSAAEHDVLENARRRWPAIRFRVENVAVQGVNAVPQVTEALQVLARDRQVDVIVVARGGGSVEDLLPFSDESLVRAVAACPVPVVSAIGHETDVPLLDLVADVRASTPTDAAKRIVPDLAEQRALVRHARDRVRRSVRDRLIRERAGLVAVRSRPVLARPAEALVVRRREQVRAARDRTRRWWRQRLERDRLDLAHALARVQALSPAATLERGYAVVQLPDGRVLRRPDEVAPGDLVRLRLAGGDLPARVAAAEELTRHQARAREAS
jgi:exodeoxyribonuclease VII large subunit